MKQPNDNPYIIPGAIIVAGGLIALAVLFSGGNTPTNSGSAGVSGDSDTAQKQQEQKPESIELKPVTDEDHIRGNKEAAVKIVEFSDFSCPFCKRFHPTVQRALDEYEGQVAWVHRHFPLTSRHPHAQKQAEASECVAAQGGNDAFWKYADLLFEEQSVPTSQLAALASQVGVDSAAVQQCLDSDTYAEAVKDDLDDGTTAGARGTPYSVVIAPNGKTFPVNGAQPYSTLKTTIDLALQEK